MSGHPCLPLPLAKQCSHSVSTQDSPRLVPKQIPFSNPNIPLKEKSQLCKKFIQFGYCPYGDRCKFAHGKHELRKDNTKNCKYKTKECACFVQEGCCPYGNRCNFIHPKPKIEKTGILDLEFLQMRWNRHESSRLMAALHKH